MLTAIVKGRYDVFGIGLGLRRAKKTVANVRYPGFYYTNDFRPGYYLDGLFNSYAYDILIGSLSAYHLMGVQVPHEGLSFAIGNEKPSTSRDYDAWNDGRRYGNAVTSLLKIVSPTGSGLPDSWHRESSTRHMGARGRLESSTGFRDVYLGRTNTSFYGRTLGKFATSDTRYDRLYRSLRISYPPGTIAISRGSTAVSTPNGVRYDLDEIKDLINGKDVQGTIDGFPFLSYTDNPGYARNTLYYWDFRVNRHQDDREGYVDFKYKLRNVATSKLKVDKAGVIALSDHAYEVTCRVAWSMAAPSSGGPLLAGEFPIHQPYFTVRSNYELISEYNSYPLPTGYLWPVGSVWNATNLWTPHPSTEGTGVFLYEQPTVSSSERSYFDQDERHIFFHHSEDTQVKRFYSFCKSIHDDVRPMACFSANDALSNCHSDSNFLESLPELPSILRNIKDVSKFFSAFRKISRGDPSGVPGVIDGMASGYLAYKYGARPLASDIQEANRIATEYYGILERRSKVLAGNLYGKFTYKLPVHCPKIPGSILVTSRTKIVMGSSPSGALAYAIALDDVGLLPTLARIWDLVPFSFVIDWFTGLSKKFETIDLTAVRAALDVAYYCHTFEYKLILDEGSYPSFSAASSEITPHLRVFVRDISRHHPMYVKGRFDFNPPVGIKKNLLAAGALLWVCT